VEVDPEPHRGRNETTYEIASDIPSPTTAPSIETDEFEREYDVESPSHPFEFVRLYQIGGFSKLTQRVPAEWKFSREATTYQCPTSWSGTRGSEEPPHVRRTARLSPLVIDFFSRNNPIVAGDRSGGESNVQAQDGLGGTTPSATEDQYDVVGSDSPTPTISHSHIINNIGIFFSAALIILILGKVRNKS
jgi:hypothetical protein